MTDILQVGLTEDANEKLLQLRTDTPYFGEESDVYRFSVALALARGDVITQAMVRQKFKAKFRAVMESEEQDEILARLDSTDRQLAGLISLHRPELSAEPYRYSQALAVIGINYLYHELVEKRRTLHDAVMALQEEVEEASSD